MDSSHIIPKDPLSQVHQSKTSVDNELVINDDSRPSERQQRIQNLIYNSDPDLLSNMNSS